MSEYLSWCVWLAAALLLGIVDELFRARRKRIGGWGEASRRLSVALSISEVTRIEAALELPTIGPEDYGDEVGITETTLSDPARRGAASALRGGGGPFGRC